MSLNCTRIGENYGNQSFAQVFAQSNGQNSVNGPSLEKEAAGATRREPVNQEILKEGNSSPTALHPSFLHADRAAEAKANRKPHTILLNGYDQIHKAVSESPLRQSMKEAVVAKALGEAINKAPNEASLKIELDQAWSALPLTESSLKKTVGEIRDALDLKEKVNHPLHESIRCNLVAKALQESSLQNSSFRIALEEGMSAFRLQRKVNDKNISAADLRREVLVAFYTFPLSQSQLKNEIDTQSSIPLLKQAINGSVPESVIKETVNKTISLSVSKQALSLDVEASIRKAKDYYSLYLTNLFHDLRIIEERLNYSELIDTLPQLRNIFRHELIRKDLQELKSSTKTGEKVKTHREYLNNLSDHRAAAHAFLQYYAMLFGGQIFKGQLEKLELPNSHYTFFQNQEIREKKMSVSFVDTEIFGPFLQDLTSDERKEFSEELKTAWIYAGDIVAVDVRHLL